MLDLTNSTKLIGCLFNRFIIIIFMIKFMMMIVILKILCWTSFDHADNCLSYLPKVRNPRNTKDPYICIYSVYIFSLPSTLRLHAVVVAMRERISLKWLTGWLFFFWGGKIFINLKTNRLKILLAELVCFLHFPGSIISKVHHHICWRIFSSRFGHQIFFAEEDSNCCTRQVFLQLFTT